MNTPLVSIIIPNFNSFEYIKQFTESLFSTDYPNFEVIIVDDGSKDGTKEYLESFSKDEKRLRLVSTLKKRGLTRSRNIAIEYARGEYISFVETDMLFEKNWLSEAIKVLESDLTIGGIHGKVLDANHPENIQAIGLKLIPQTGWVALIGFGEKNSDFKAKSEEVAMGAVGTVTRSSVIRTIRGFDEEMDRIDDIDLGWRLWISGNRVVSVPSSVTYHVTVKSWNIRKKSVTKIQQEMATARIIRMLIKNYELKNVIIFVPQAIAILSARALLNLLKGNIYPLVGLLCSFWWTLKTFPSTLDERKYIQSTRMFTDKRIMSAVMTDSNLLTIFHQYHKEVNSKLKELKNEDLS